MKAEAPAEEGKAAEHGSGLPRKMLANKALAGRSCPACSATLELGQPVRNCELCGATHHEVCWGQHGGCATPLCANSPLPSMPEPAAAPVPPVTPVPPVPPVQSAPPDRAGSAPAVEPPGPGADKDRKPCPSCGELIVVRASKCRFCGEILSPAPSAAAVRRSPVAAAGPRKNGLAIASLVCGISSIFFCFLGYLVGPVAIGLAIGARRDMARRDADPASQTMASAGLITGAVGTMTGFILLLMMLSAG
jgi:hypothetical protein